MPYILKIRRRTGKIVILQPDQFFINRNTEVGEPADFYERKPFNGRRYIPEREILAHTYVKEPDKKGKYKK